MKRVAALMLLEVKGFYKLFLQAVPTHYNITTFFLYVRPNIVISIINKF